MTKSGKHWGKRRNCSFWAISSFVTIFSKSCLLQTRRKASIWGKGLMRKTLANKISHLFTKWLTGLKSISHYVTNLQQMTLTSFRPIFGKCLETNYWIEIAHYEHFIFFSTMFYKYIWCRGLKLRLFVKNG